MLAKTGARRLLAANATANTTTTTTATTGAAYTTMLSSTALKTTHTFKSVETKTPFSFTFSFTGLSE